MASETYPKIQPHWVSKATDICAVGKTVYIIRSDLKCFMVTSDLKTGKDIAVHALHQNCQGGDHYFANSKGFYIIKGNSVRFVKNLTTAKGSKTFMLHKKCQGGTHYASLVRVIKPWFVIIWADKGRARVVQNLKTDHKGRNISLANDCKGGIYYWGSPHSVFSGYKFLMPTQWGQTYQFTRNLERNVSKTDLPVCEAILPFLPGGLSVSQGASYGRWEHIKKYKNSSDTTVHWEQKIKTIVGYRKSELKSIEKHWDVKCHFQAGIAANIVKLQFSMGKSYGGSETETSEEAWTNSIEEEETITVDIPAGETLHIWQYQLGFNSKPVLFSRDTVVTFSSVPPEEDPQL